MTTRPPSEKMRKALGIALFHFEATDSPQPIPVSVFLHANISYSTIRGLLNRDWLRERIYRNDKWDGPPRGYGASVWLFVLTPAGVEAAEKWGKLQEPVP